MVILRKTYDAPTFNEKEILRYAGCKTADESTMKLLFECLEISRDAFSYNVCYTNVPIDFIFSKTDSKSLMKNLEGCSEAILFGATVGVEIDRLIAKYGRISPAKAVMLQAIGAERIESLCDLFNDEIKGEYESTRPRFSPGYGDLSVELQKDIFRLLDCPKNIGLSLNDSMMMSPSKSVTAIIGVKK